MVCFRLLADSEKGAALADAITATSAGVIDDRVTWTNPGAFSLIPGSPFSYWVANAFRRLFSSLPPFESEGRRVLGGLKTMHDDRFVRAWWEIPATGISETGWARFVKGGSYSPFYTSIALVVGWQHKGDDISWFSYQRRPREGFGASSRGLEAYFKPALTWPLRAAAFSPQVLPKGCIFSNRSHVAVAGMEELTWLLGLMASEIFDYLFKVLVGRFGFPEFIVGTLQVLPIPTEQRELKAAIGTLAIQAWKQKCMLDTAESTSPLFVQPASTEALHLTIVESAREWSDQVRISEDVVTSLQSQLNSLALRLYGIPESDGSLLSRTVPEDSTTISVESTTDEEDSGDLIGSGNPAALTSELIAYAAGCAFGRWDIRFATCEKPVPELPDPFAPLPVCPPGQLQNEQGLPIAKEDVERRKEEGQWNYPIEIPWDGILVDDPGHPLDIETRVQQVLQVIWQDRWEAIEREACEILGVKSLRDYFYRPASFFADHLKRYSKSRRQAPIYWPLSTASGGYTLWIYYHRLTENTLHTALADFIDPKLRSMRAEISALRESGARRDRLEELLDLEKELEDFRAEIERIIKLPWKPNLNDGVLITASPLCKLFRLSKWQKDLKACWEQLAKGDYDWAHLAYVIWPKRVEEVCKTDRSIAIAHGLEHLCQIEAQKPKVKRGKKNAAL